MTTLYDPHRPRINDLPALSRTQIIPRLMVWPEETEDRVRISAMIPVEGERYVAREVAASASVSSLPEIIALFRSDPEEFLRTFFKLTKIGTQPNPTKPKQAATDLELGI